MKKITEELNRYNSINKYISEQFNPAGTTNSPGIANFPVITPTVVKEPVKAVDNTVSNAYNIMLDGFEGPGTKPKYIIDGLNMLKNSNQFIELNNLFVTKKPDGYGSFQDMINGEFEYTDSVSTNTDDLNKVNAKLKSLGINATMTRTSTGYYKEDGYKITLPVQTKVVEPVTSKVTDTKTPAKDNKPVVKVNPALQQTMTINKQIQQVIGTPNKTGKLSQAELEKLIGLLRPKVTAANELTPAATTTTAAPVTAATIPQQ